MEEKVVNLKFEKVQVIIEEEVKNPPRPSYEHCSDNVAMILFVSLILTVITAGSLIMMIPMVSLIVSGIIYILQIYQEPIRYHKKHKRIRKGR